MNESSTARAWEITVWVTPAFDPQPFIFEFNGSRDEVSRHIPRVGSPFGGGVVMRWQFVCE